MPDFINIISQEAVTAVPTWLAMVGAAIATLVVVSTFIYWAIVKDCIATSKYLCAAGVFAIVFATAWACITSMFFSVPTGRYRYEATIDKDNITVARYEEFIEEYSPTIKDGVYYFVGGGLNE